MEVEATFVATAITDGPLDDVSTHVAWGGDATDAEHALILMRNDHPGPGEAPYCVVWGVATEYGGVSDIQVQLDRTTVELTEQCAAALGAPRRICIGHDVEALDLGRLRAAVQRIMAD